MASEGGATYQDLFGSDEEDEGEARAAGVDEEGVAAAAVAEVGGEEGGGEEGGGEEGGDHASARAGAGGDGAGGEEGADGEDLDLFGEREEEAEGEDEGATDGERAARSARQGMQAEDAPRAPPLALNLPPLPRPKPGRLCLVRLPNILGIQARPFDAHTYDPADEAEHAASRQNVVRWRYAASGAAAAGGDGEVERESNARVVRWSDGSLTLHIGSEVLLATEQPLESEHAHVFARGPKSLIECHGVLSRRLHFQPATRDSATHRTLMSKVQNTAKMGKERKIRMTSTLSDPEKAKEAMEKLEEEKKRLLLSQDRAGAHFGAGAGAGRWEAGFLEGGDDADPGEGELGAIRAQLTGRKRRSAGGGSRTRRTSRARRPAMSGASRRLSGGAGAGAARRRSRAGDDEEEEEEEEEEEAGSDDDMEGFIVDDEEDDDEGVADDDDDDEL